MEDEEGQAGGKEDVEGNRADQECSMGTHQCVKFPGTLRGAP